MGELGIGSEEKEHEDENQVYEVDRQHGGRRLGEPGELGEDAGEDHARQAQQEEPVEVGAVLTLHPVAQAVHQEDREAHENHHRAGVGEDLEEGFHGPRHVPEGERGMDAVPVMVPIPTTVPMKARPANPHRVRRWPQIRFSLSRSPGNACGS